MAVGSKADLVLEGGGVNGIGLVDAYLIFIDEGDRKVVVAFYGDQITPRSLA